MTGGPDDSISALFGEPEHSQLIDREARVAFDAIHDGLFGFRDGSRFADRYDLVKRLGTGGMGEVYSAHDQSLKRTVAIKLVREDERDAGTRERLRSALLEGARHAAKVDHPNVVPVYEAGIHEDEPYVVMKLVEGTTLSAWLDSCPRSWREIVEIFLGAAEGLAAVHRYGIVHGDFKPDNVLIDEDGRPRVADFGLARAVTDDLPTLDAGGRLVTKAAGGTPSFMAPEQVRGGEISTLSDQFSFFASLYRALVGKLPFPGSSPEELLPSIEGGPPTTTRRLRAPRRLLRLISRGLAPSPLDRHRSMEVVIGELRSLLRRRRRVVLSGAVLGLATAAGLAGHAWPKDTACNDVEPPWTETRRENLRAVLAARAPAELEDAMSRLDGFAEQWRAARKETCEATHVEGSQSDWTMELRQACLGRQRARFESTTEQLSSNREVDVLELVRGLPPMSICDAGSVLSSPTLRANAWQNDTDRARGSEREWAELTRRLISARAQGPRASRAAFEEARSVARRAEQLHFRHIQAEALLIQGVYGLELSRDEEERRVARRNLEKAATLAVETGGSWLAAQVYFRLALARPSSSSDQGFLLDQAKAHARTISGSEDLMLSIETARCQLAQDEGQYETAKRCFEGVLDGFGLRSETISAAAGLVDVLSFLQDSEAARAACGRLEALDPPPALLAVVYRNQAFAASNRGAHDEALAYVWRARELLSNGRRDHPTAWLEVGVHEARVLRELGRYAQARRLLDELARGIDREGSIVVPALLGVLDELVELEMATGDYEAAMLRAEQWKALARRGRAHDDPDVVRATMMLGQAARMAGELERALVEGAAAHRVAPADPLLRIECTWRYAQALSDAGDASSAQERLDELSRTFDEHLGYEYVEDLVRGWAEETGLDYE